MSRKDENKQASVRVARSRKIRKDMGLAEARVVVWVDAHNVEKAREIMRESVADLRVYLEDEIP